MALDTQPSRTGSSLGLRHHCRSTWLPACPITYERVDADGYPFTGVGLHTLPITVPIVQVADAYDAMTSDRPYEGPLPVNTTLAELLKCAGTQFC